ncbi:Protein of unknown function [Propionibacterium freudenreichii]|nr:Protein of unknown function [Propionibacterium freudenreichii]
MFHGHHGASSRTTCI